MDNRPLKYEEFETLQNQGDLCECDTLLTMNWSKQRECMSNKSFVQLDYLTRSLKSDQVKTKSMIWSKKFQVRAEADERVLVTTLTKRMAEELT
jgi:excinuclease ABC subunit B